MRFGLREPGEHWQSQLLRWGQLQIHEIHSYLFLFPILKIWGSSIESSKLFEPKLCAAERLCKRRPDGSGISMAVHFSWGPELKEVLHLRRNVDALQLWARWESMQKYVTIRYYSIYCTVVVSAALAMMFVCLFVCLFVLLRYMHCTHTTAHSNDTVKHTHCLAQGSSRAQVPGSSHWQKGWLSLHWFDLNCSLLVVLEKDPRSFHGSGALTPATTELSNGQLWRHWHWRIC